MIYSIYEQCYKLGHAIGFGASEGAILYSSIIMLIITTVTSKKDGK